MSGNAAVCFGCLPADRHKMTHTHTHTPTRSPGGEGRLCVRLVPSCRRTEDDMRGKRNVCHRRTR